MELTSSHVWEAAVRVSPAFLPLALELLGALFARVRREAARTRGRWQHALASLQPRSYDLTVCLWAACVTCYSWSSPSAGHTYLRPTLLLYLGYEYLLELLVLVVCLGLLLIVRGKLAEDRPARRPAVLSLASLVVVATVSVDRLLLLLLFTWALAEPAY